MGGSKKTLLITAPDHLETMVRESRFVPCSAILLSASDDEAAQALCGKLFGLNSNLPVYGTKSIDTAPLSLESTDSDLDRILPLMKSTYSLLLLDRQPSVPPRTILQSTGIVLRAAARSLKIIRSNNIERVVSCSTPHQLATYVLYQVANEIGLECLVIERSPLPHRYWVTQGINDAFPAQSSGWQNNQLSERTSKMLRDLKESLESPLDFLTRQRKSYGADSYSLTQEMSKFVRSLTHAQPWRAAMILNKYRLHSMYESLCRERPPESLRRVTFFLHYQPERTTLPEAGYFVMQDIAIHMLASMLPPDVELIVREHPSTWLLPVYYGGRGVDQYKSMASIKRVRFVSTTHSVNELIDSSIFVATCTGKVGLQALVRGKPVLAFGFPAYGNHHYCKIIRSEKDLFDAIGWVDMQGDRLGQEISDYNDSYFRYVETVSYEEIPPGNGITPRQRRLHALTDVLNDLFKRDNIRMQGEVQSLSHR
jgi:hypothetical protein